MKFKDIFFKTREKDSNTELNYISKKNSRVILTLISGLLLSLLFGSISNNISSSDRHLKLSNYMEAYLANDSSYFSEATRRSGIRGLYRSISRPDSGVVRREKRNNTKRDFNFWRPETKKKVAPGKSLKKPKAKQKKPETKKAIKKNNRRPARVQKKSANVSKKYKKDKTKKRKNVRRKIRRGFQKKKVYRKSRAHRYQRNRRKYSQRKKQYRRKHSYRKKRFIRKRFNSRSNRKKVTTYKKRTAFHINHPRNNKNQRKAQRKKNRKKRIVPGFPTNLKPTPKKGYRYRTPAFYRGLYLTNPTAGRARRYIPLLKKARRHGVNVLVVDIQPRIPKPEFIRHARESNFYIVARVVVFPGGLKRYPPSRRRIHRMLNLTEKAARAGFMEVQLDYIRFADRYKGRRYLKLSLRKRYKLIEGVLKMCTDRLRPLGVRVGADIFGRIAFNRNDIIGQQVELFAAHLDTIYPMLYPSHFYGEPRRIRNPYNTILEGNINCIQRVRGQSRIISYIQGFRMSVRPSRLSFVRYIQKQIQAAEDSGSAGYIVWNARNRYNAYFKAVRLHKRYRFKKPLNVSRN